MSAEGIIIKGIGGFYYVETPQGVIECRARGKFRKDKLTPLVGDRVTVTIEDGPELTGSVDEILPRKNSFIRPTVANIDQMLVTFAAADPQPDLMLVDKLLATAIHENVECIICINKTDLADDSVAAQYRAIYESAGFPVYLTCARSGEGVEAVKQILPGKTTALAGNSGVGKSSLLVALGCQAETGSISEKIKRGKQTTRQVELYHLPGGGLMLDTPGFSSFEIDQLRHNELEALFIEFAPYTGACRFSGCTHRSEPDCAVKEAVQDGEIPPSRYENYVTLYNELKEIKEWMR